MFKGMLFAYCDSKMRAFNCGHYIDWGPDLGTDQEIVELWKGEWCQTLELSRIPSGFGGSRPFWLCPAVFISDRGCIPVPQVRPGELQEPTGYPKRFYVLLSQGHGPGGKAP